MVFLVTYTLQAKGMRSRHHQTDVASLERELQKFPAWCHLSERTWLIATYDDISAINEKLAPFVSEDDSWVVVRLTNEYTGWQPQGIWDWLKDSFERIGP